MILQETLPEVPEAADQNRDEDIQLPDVPTDKIKGLLIVIMPYYGWFSCDHTPYP